MNKKNAYNIIITVLVSMVVVVVLITAITGKFEYEIWRYVICLVFGIVSGIFLFLIWKRPISSTLAWFPVTTFLATIISLFITIDKDVANYFLRKSDNIHDKTDIIDIKKELYDANADNHLAIFALDITKYNNTPDISETQRKVYNRYMSSIKNTIYVEEEKPISHAEFFRAKICADLVALQDSPGKFLIYIVDRDTKGLFDEEPKIFTKENIQEAIVNLYSEKFQITSETETNLKIFHEKICAVTGQDGTLNKHDFTKYVLYAYSDFVHENENPQKFKEDTAWIHDCQTKLENKNIVQNLYKIPCDVENTDKRACILDRQTDHPFYLNIYQAEDFKPTDNAKERHRSYHKIKYKTDTIYTNLIERCSPNLFFLEPKTNQYSIRTTEKLEDDLQILYGSKKKHLPDKFQSIEEENIPLFLGISFPKDKIFLDIAMGNGVHNIVNIDFQYSFPNYFIWLFPSLWLLSGLWLGYLLTSKLKNTKI